MHVPEEHWQKWLRYLNLHSRASIETFGAALWTVVRELAGLKVERRRAHDEGRGNEEESNE